MMASGVEHANETSRKSRKKEGQLEQACRFADTNNEERKKEHNKGRAKGQTEHNR